MYKVIKKPGSEEEERFTPHFFRKIDFNDPDLADEEYNERRFVPLCPNGKNGVACGDKEDSGKNGQDLLELQEKARMEGFAQGEKAGREMERKGLESLFNALHKAVAGVNSLGRELRQNAEKEAVELALAIARKVVFHEISINAQTILDVLRGALEKVVDQEEVRIKVNARDLEIINESGFDIKGERKDIKAVTIEADDTVERGGCVIETDFGSIDARVRSRLQAVEDLLRPRMP